MTERRKIHAAEGCENISNGDVSGGKLEPLVRHVAELINRRIGQTARPTASCETPRVSKDWPDWWPVTLRRLADMFALSAFEAQFLLLCAGVELDVELARAVALENRAMELSGCSGAPTFALALTGLDGAHPDACLPGGSLRHWRMVEIGPGDSTASSPLRIDERLVAYLLGVPTVDYRLEGVVDWGALPAIGAAGAPSDVTHETVRRVIAAWTGNGPERLWPRRAILVGPMKAPTIEVAALIAMHLNRGIALVRGDALPTERAEQGTFFRLLEREVRLLDALAVLDCRTLDDAPFAGYPGESGGGEGRTGARFAERLIEDLNLDLIALTRRRRIPRAIPAVQYEMPPCDLARRLEIWRAALGDRYQELHPAIEPIARLFNFDVIDAVSIAHQVSASLAVAETDDVDAWGAAFRTSARARVRAQLDGLAHRVEEAKMKDLILPPESMLSLDQIVANMRQRSALMTDVGTEDRQGASAASSCIALFSGPSGTGKTLAASAVGRRLGLDVFRVDLSEIMSKYIGETEGNLRRLFDAAEGGGVVLLFDEADALFGKRTEVRDSRDRYANIQINYLLQRLENFDGLAILTTNMPTALDQAFSRRIRFSVSFPHPDARARAEIWRISLPHGVPWDDIDFAALAQLSLPGGHIKNIAFNAGCLAMDGQKPISMAILLDAARAECAKIGRPLSEREVGQWR